jgi:hypothetical protein
MKEHFVAGYIKPLQKYMNIYGRQSNTILKDVNIQKGYLFRLKTIHPQALQGTFQAEHRGYIWAIRKHTLIYHRCFA